jgi:hypothetical protein
MRSSDLQGTFPWMITATSKQTWRFDSEVTDFLLSAVQKAYGELGLGLILCLLELLLLGRAEGFLPGLFSLEMFVHDPKITQFEGSDFSAISLDKKWVSYSVDNLTRETYRGMFFEHGFKVVEKVLVKCGVLGMISL